MASNQLLNFAELEIQLRLLAILLSSATEPRTTVQLRVSPPTALLAMTTPTALSPATARTDSASELTLDATEFAEMALLLQVSNAMTATPLMAIAVQDSADLKPPAFSAELQLVDVTHLSTALAWLANVLQT
jgi:hypothetical protein